jgi:hypothetical protein
MYVEVVHSCTAICHYKARRFGSIPEPPADFTVMQELLHVKVIGFGEMFWSRMYHQQKDQ